MKAIELRIGNWIQDKKDRQIDTLLVAHLGEGLINYWNEEVYQPILLEKDWLLRLGFIHNDDEKLNIFFYGIRVGGSTLSVNPDNGVAWITRNENILNVPGLIKHVHQLQNLYYALTGEELTLKVAPQQ